jgi:hypothetical protein
VTRIHIIETSAIGPLLEGMIHLNMLSVNFLFSSLRPLSVDAAQSQDDIFEHTNEILQIWSNFQVEGKKRFCNKLQNGQDTLISCCIVFFYALSSPRRTSLFAVDFIVIFF